VEAPVVEDPGAAVEPEVEPSEPEGGSSETEGMIPEGE
jgi:hypothetical protein